MSSLHFRDPYLRAFIKDADSEIKFLCSCVGTGKSTATIMERFVYDPMMRGGTEDYNPNFDRFVKQHGMPKLAGRKVVHRKGIIGRESLKGFSQTLKSDIQILLNDFEGLVNINEQTNEGTVVIISDKRIFYTTFHVVSFKKPESYTTLHGGNFSWMWLNEIGLSDHNKWDDISFLISRTGRWNGRRAIVIDSNPPST